MLVNDFLARRWLASLFKPLFGLAPLLRHRVLQKERLDPALRQLEHRVQREPATRAITTDQQSVEVYLDARRHTLQKFYKMVIDPCPEVSDVFEDVGSRVLRYEAVVWQHHDRGGAVRERDKIVGEPVRE